MNDLMELHKGWIRESNLIEGVDDPQADTESFEAWKKFTEHKMTKETILTLHWDILKRLNPTINGLFRRCNVAIYSRGEVVYRGPDWKLVPNLMKEWLRVHTRAKTKDEILFAHIIFERIHPFQDGNGRVGRMIMNSQLLSNGLEPIIFYAKDRHLYYKIFNEFDKKTGKKWMRDLLKTED